VIMNFGVIMDSSSLKSMITAESMITAGW